MTAGKLVDHDGMYVKAATGTGNATPTPTPTGASAGYAPSAGDLDAMVQAAVRNALQAAGAAAAAQAEKAPVTAAEVTNWALTHFGYMAAYLNHPEIGPLIRAAAHDRVTSAEVLFGRLAGTKWWQSTSATTRQNDYLRKTDPAEWRRMVDEQTAKVTNRARTLGIEMGGQVRDFAERALMAGWTEAQVDDYLVQRVQHQGSFTAGDLGGFQAQVKAVAGQFLTFVSDATAAEYARRMASGELTLDGVAAVFRSQAKQRFAYMGDQIDAGGDVATAFAPLRDRISQTLEKAPTDVDLMDPKYLDMVETVDAKTGQRRMATDYEVVQRARTQPEWWKTTNAQSTWYGTVGALRAKAGI